MKQQVSLREANQHFSRYIEAVEKGARIVLSPADRVYLDMKYDADTALGYDWAGFVEVEDAYDWDPATLIAGVSEADVLGVEAPLWTETLMDIGDVEIMTFPRLPAIAEVAWSRSDRRTWDEFRTRLAAQAQRWAAMEIGRASCRERVWIPV